MSKNVLKNSLDTANDKLFGPKHDVSSERKDNVEQDLVLNVCDLSIQFRMRKETFSAVKNSSFTLKRGSILGIVGESGSGKSVSCYSLLGLIKCPPGEIAGAAVFNSRHATKFPHTQLQKNNITPDRSEPTMASQRYDLLSIGEKALRRLRGQRIAIIFQDPMTSLNPNMSVGKQIVEALQAHSDLSFDEAKQRAINAMEEVGIRLAEERFHSYPFEFSGGMRQRVMIAMALITEPEVLIADEPTTALDVTVQKQILDLLKTIQKTRELSILFITHDLAVISELADELIVMEKGAIVERGEAKAVLHSPSHPYTKRLIKAIPSAAKPVAHRYDAKLTADEEAQPHQEDHAHVSVKGIKTRFLTKVEPFWYRGKAPRKQYFEALKGIDFSIAQGEILGLVGESGSGKSTLGRSIIRLVDAYEGESCINSVDLYKLEAKELRLARSKFQMIFQDPYASLNPRMTVFDTLAEPLRANKLVGSAELPREINRLMDEVGLSRRAVRKYPHEFSGGQRQRIAIGRALASRPEFIVADEPVSALDVTIQAQILDLILDLVQERSLTMLFISHDLSVVRYLCDRVAVMRNGEIVETGLTEQIYENPTNDYTKELLGAIPLLN